MTSRHGPESSFLPNMDESLDSLRDDLDMRSTPRPQLLLIGAQGLGVEVAECARQLGYDVVGCLDDDPSLSGMTSPGGAPVLGTTDAIGTLDAFDEGENPSVAICVGHGTARQRVVDRLAGLGVSADRYVTLIHPDAVVPAGTEVGAGTIILAGVVITAPIVIGSFVVVMPHVTMTHDNSIEDFVTLAAGVRLGGSVRVGTEAYLGMNSAVREHCAVGARSTLGMGAALVRDLPVGETWVGVPARPSRH